MIQGEPESDFQRAGIALSCPDNFLSKTCYFMIISDPKLYYHARIKDLIWQVSMDEEMNSLKKKHYLGASFSSLGKKIGSMQVGVSDQGCC